MDSYLLSTLCNFLFIWIYIHRFIFKIITIFINPNDQFSLEVCFGLTLPVFGCATGKFFFFHLCDKISQNNSKKHEFEVSPVFLQGTLILHLDFSSKKRN